MDNVRLRASYSPIKRSYYTKPAFRPKNLKQDVKTSRVKNMTTAGIRAVVNTGKGKMNNDLNKSRWVWRPKGNYIDHESKEKGSFILKKFEYVDPKGISRFVDHAVVDSGCSSHMTGNKAYLLDYEDYNGGFVAFGSDPKGGKIIGKGIQESYVAGSLGKDKEPTQEYILLPLHLHRPRIPVEDVIQDAQEKSFENAPNDKGELDSEDIAAEQALKDDLEGWATSINKLNTGRPSINTANTPYVSAASTPISANAGESSFVYLGGQIPIDASTLPNVDLPTDPNMPDLEDVSNAFPNDSIFSGAYDDNDVGTEADFKNIDNTIDVSNIPTLRVHKDHPKGQILGDPKSIVQTRGKIGLFSTTSFEEPKNISQALQDESWVEAMQEQLLQFKLQKVWVLVDLPYGKKLPGKEAIRYLKHQPKLGLWYPRDSPFELEAFLDSDYGGASLDRKSITGGCQFLGRRLISWQYKKQMIVANSPTEAEYVAAANFKNPVYHLRTKHIEIRHHFIRDSYEKRLINVVKIHTDNNVTDILTKGFDVIRFNFLVLELILLGNIMDLRMDGSYAAGISNLPDAEIYDGLATLRFLQMILGITTENNGKYLASTLTKKLFANMKRGYAGNYVPLLPAMLAGAAEDQGEGSAIPAEPKLSFL
ncbi:hypothetical protein Tco_1156346 [Tanacetum coccineum]